MMPLFANFRNRMILTTAAITVGNHWYRNQCNRQTRPQFSLRRAHLKSLGQIYEDMFTHLVRIGIPIQTASKRGTELHNGSGFVVNDSGYVVTNVHVTDEHKRIVWKCCYEESGDMFVTRMKPVDVVYVEPGIDLALVRMTDPDPELMAVNIRSDVGFGEELVMIGFPSDIIYCLTTGLGMNSDRKAETYSIGRWTYFPPYVDLSKEFLMHTIITFGGQSGSPLVDSEGNVVAVLTGEVELGSGVAIPGSYLNAFIDRGMRFEVMAKVKRYVCDKSLGLIVIPLNTIDKNTIKRIPGIKNYAQGITDGLIVWQLINWMSPTGSAEDMLFN